MQIWVDADACPGAIKELLFRAVERRKFQMTLVANTSIRIPNNPLIQIVVVASGMNIADRKIVELASAGDLVITADIPLAADVIAKGAQALNPRGELYTEANIGERVATRNMLDGLRGDGQISGGPASFSPKDRQTFANQFDRWLVKAEALAKRTPRDAP